MTINFLPLTSNRFASWILPQTYHHRWSEKSEEVDCRPQLLIMWMTEFLQSTEFFKLTRLIKTLIKPNFCVPPLYPDSTHPLIKLSVHPKLHPFIHFHCWTNQYFIMCNRSVSFLLQVIDNCQCLLDERKVVEDLMNKCEKISSKIEDMLKSRLEVLS